MSPMSPNNRTCFDQVSRHILKRHHSAKAMTQFSSSSTVARARTTSRDDSSVRVKSPTFIPRQRSISYTGTVKRATPRPYPRALSPAFPHFGSRSLQTMVNTSSLGGSPPGKGRFIRYVTIETQLAVLKMRSGADEQISGSGTKRRAAKYLRSTGTNAYQVRACKPSPRLRSQGGRSRKFRQARSSSTSQFFIKLHSQLANMTRWPILQPYYRDSVHLETSRRRFITLYWYLI